MFCGKVYREYKRLIKMSYFFMSQFIVNTKYERVLRFSYCIILCFMIRTLKWHFLTMITASQTNETKPKPSIHPGRCRFSSYCCLRSEKDFSGNFEHWVLELTFALGDVSFLHHVLIEYPNHVV